MQLLFHINAFPFHTISFSALMWIGRAHVNCRQRVMIALVEMALNEAILLLGCHVLAPHNCLKSW